MPGPRQRGEEFPEVVADELLGLAAHVGRRPTVGVGEAELAIQRHEAVLEALHRVDEVLVGHSGRGLGPPAVGDVQHEGQNREAAGGPAKRRVVPLAVNDGAVLAKVAVGVDGPRALAAQHVGHHVLYQVRVVGVHPVELVDAFADGLGGGPPEDAGRLIGPADDLVVGGGPLDDGQGRVLEERLEAQGRRLERLLDVPGRFADVLPGHRGADDGIARPQGDRRGLHHHPAPRGVPKHERRGRRRFSGQRAAHQEPIGADGLPTDVAHAMPLAADPHQLFELEVEGVQAEEGCRRRVGPGDFLGVIEDDHRPRQRVEDRLEPRRRGSGAPLPPRGGRCRL